MTVICNQAAYQKSRYPFLVLVFFCLLLLPCGCTPVEPEVPSDDLSLPADMVETVYFHRIRRCEACIFAEERIQYVINTYFQQELAEGRLVFGIFAVEDKNNDELVRKYGAIGSQLFINRIIDGVDHIRYVKEIWNWGIIDDVQVFDSTVRDIIQKSIYGSTVVY